MPDINTHITDYSKTMTQLVEKGLLDLWGRLGEYRDYLVIVGGLVRGILLHQKGHPIMMRACIVAQWTLISVFPLQSLMTRNTRKSVRSYLKMDIVIG